MRLIVIYCILLAVGEVIAFGLGLVVEQVVPSLGLLVYMAMFFGVMWGAWLLTVELDERYSARAAPSRNFVRE